MVPTDFTSTCLNAVLHAVELAKPTNGKVYILHVLEGKDADDETLVYSAMEKITDLSETIDYENIEPLVKSGDIFTTINEVAVNKHAECIILGTHGKKGFQKLLGSYALKVIDSTKLPVMVVQDNAVAGKIETIVFPVDLDEEDRQKTGYAVKLAKTHGAIIHIFPKVESLAENRLKNHNVIKQIVDYIQKHGVQYVVAENFDTSSDFSKQVVNYSNKVNANLILILTDAKSHFFVLGAKEEDFLFNSSHIPVMCVNERLYKSAKFSVVG